MKNFLMTGEKLTERNNEIQGPAWKKILNRVFVFVEMKADAVWKNDSNFLWGRMQEVVVLAITA